MNTVEDMVKFWGIQPLLRNIADAVEGTAKEGTFSQFHNPRVAEKIRELVTEIDTMEKEEGRKYMDIVMSVTKRG